MAEKTLKDRTLILGAYGLILSPYMFSHSLSPLILIVLSICRKMDCGNEKACSQWCRVLLLSSIVLLQQIIMATSPMFFFTFNQTFLACCYVIICLLYVVVAVRGFLEAFHSNS